MNNEIKNAVDVSQRAQRNYDLSKSVSKEDLETLIYAAVNSPSKQNETHYQLKVYTDQNKIKEVYNCTKRFSLIKDEEDRKNSFKEDIDGVFWQNEDTSVYNSQILSNVLFIYVDDTGSRRSGESIIAKENNNTNSESFYYYESQKNYSIGISVGQLILSAALLGYKTGICSAFNPDAVQQVINTSNKVRLLVGIGFENSNLDRRLHAELLNKNVPEKFRTGNLDEHWRFPSFEKNIKVTING